MLSKYEELIGNLDISNILYLAGELNILLRSSDDLLDLESLFVMTTNVHKGLKVLDIRPFRSKARIIG